MSPFGMMQTERHFRIATWRHSVDDPPTAILSVAQDISTKECEFAQPVTHGIRRQIGVSETIETLAAGDETEMKQSAQTVSQC